MDPKQALLDAQQALANSQIRAAIRALRDYRGWRAGGGFEPVMAPAIHGDTLFDALVAKVRERSTARVWMRAGLGR